MRTLGPVSVELPAGPANHDASRTVNLAARKASPRNGVTAMSNCLFSACRRGATTVFGSWNRR